jgi:hypothetical protein
MPEIEIPLIYYGRNKVIKDELKIIGKISLKYYENDMNQLHEQKKDSADILRLVLFYPYCY